MSLPSSMADFVPCDHVAKGLLILSRYSDRDIFIAADIVGSTPTLHRYFTDTLPNIAILSVYIQVF